jgi:hypothetical protein
MDCPFCGDSCDAEYVDVGVGQQQVTPFYCYTCQASEVSSYQDMSELSELERFVGWHQGTLPPQDELRQWFKEHLELQEEIKCSKEDVFLISPLLHWLEARE